MHFVSKKDSSIAQTPKAYENQSSGFRRATYVDRAMGSVHMGTGICDLDANGVISPHLHSFEESFYILEGNLVVQVGEQAYQIAPGNFGLISTGVPHSWRNLGEVTARWLEMQAPQPRPGRSRSNCRVGQPVRGEPSVGNDSCFTPSSSKQIVIEVNG